MPVQLPYLPSNKNVPALFEKIASAKIPDKFNHNFLQTTIGLKSTNDRALIPLLRNLGFVDQSGTPTPSYRMLKGDSYKAAIADGTRNAYGPLFDADQSANELSGDKLKSLIAQVAGTNSDMEFIDYLKRGTMAATEETLRQAGLPTAKQLPKDVRSSQLLELMLNSLKPQIRAPLAEKDWEKVAWLYDRLASQLGVPPARSYPRIMP